MKSHVYYDPKTNKIYDRKEAREIFVRTLKDLYIRGFCYWDIGRIMHTNHNFIYTEFPHTIFTPQEIGKHHENRTIMLRAGKIKGNQSHFGSRHLPPIIEEIRKEIMQTEFSRINFRITGNVFAVEKPVHVRTKDR